MCTKRDDAIRQDGCKQNARASLAAALYDSRNRRPEVRGLLKESIRPGNKNELLQSAGCTARRNDENAAICRFAGPLPSAG